MNESHQSTVDWKTFLKITVESLISFYLATFCLAMVFIHRGNSWIPFICSALLYFFVIFVCAKRVWQHLSIATLMLIIPIAPFIALAIIVSLIPILEFFKN